MEVLNVKDLKGTDREVYCPKGGFVSNRILLESDDMGYSLTKTEIPSGKGPQTWHYKTHLETCYCIQGRGVLIDVKTRQEHDIVPGSVYILNDHDRHTFEALEDVVLICVFNPPLTGKEVHQEDGSYKVA